MRRLNDDDILAIRQQANIVDVISSYIPLQKAGRSYLAVCPFHDDTNPSLSVDPDKQIYKCFACNHGGNVFGFVRDYEQISFIEAVIKVGQMVGIDLSAYNLNTYKPKIDPKIQRLYSLMDEAQQYVEFTLRNSKDDLVKNFIKERQLTQELIETFQIGYIDPEFPLVNYLHRKGYQHQEIEEVHLAALRDNDYYDVFNSRILFPIKTHDNQIVAYTARSLTDHHSKYINSATSPIYNKSDILYNYHNATDRLIKDDVVVLCEGVMDVIAFHKSKHPKTISTLGTALSDQQIQLIKRLNSPIVLAYDGDDAGQKATFRIGSQLREHLLDVSVLNNPSTLDPDDIIKEHSPQALKEMVDKPKHWMEFILDYATKLHSLNSYNARRDVVDFALKHLKSYDDIDQEYFTSQLALLTQFDVQTIKASLIQLKKPKRTRVVAREIKTEQTNHFLQSEKQIINYLIAGKNFGQQFKVKLGYLLNQHANELALLILNLYKFHDTISIADCLNLNLNSIQEALLLEISEETMYQFPKTEKHLNELMIQVQLADIQNLLAENQQSILDATDPKVKLELMNQKIQLLQKQDKLKTEVLNEEI